MTIHDNSLPNIDESQLDIPSFEKCQSEAAAHAPRILLLYGSLRKRSFSRLVVEECARLLSRMGAEVEIFNPEGLPQTDTEDENHPKVQELRSLMMWSEGQVWCSPERHGAMEPTERSQR